MMHPPCPHKYVSRDMAFERHFRSGSLDEGAVTDPAPLLSVLAIRPRNSTPEGVVIDPEHPEPILVLGWWISFSEGDSTNPAHL